MPGRGCGTCGAPLVPREEAEARGSRGPVAIRIAPVPVLACPSDHEKVLADPNFAVDVLKLLRLPRAAQGRIRRDWRCRSCGSGLSNDLERRPDEFQLNLVLPGERRVRVGLRYPAVACPRCGARQAVWSSGLAEDVNAAFVRTLEGIGLRFA